MSRPASSLLLSSPPLFACDKQTERMSKPFANSYGEKGETTVYIKTDRNKVVGTMQCNEWSYSGEW